MNRRQLKRVIRKHLTNDLTEIQKRDRNTHILMFVAIVVISFATTWALLAAVGQ